MSRKYFVDDPMSSWLAVLAGTLPVERLAAMRLIVTSGTIIDAHAEAERKPKEHADDVGWAGALVPIGQWPVNGPGAIGHSTEAVSNARISLLTRVRTR
jgi:hypothetical protein